MKVLRLLLEGLTASALTGIGALPVAYGQVVADPNGGAHRPTVITTSNGIQQVNITAPSGAGVSQNTYTQFDVPKAGVVLNNSSAIVQTQQAGYINGNPNLASGQSASIILNQVNSNAPSQLRGYIEVAGKAAEVVVANGSGIVVDGGGFINTTRGILTTGTPQLDANGALRGFNVGGGTIAVQGDGLNASNVDQMDLIARAVQVNAALYAKELNVVTGVNQVDHDTLAATAQGPAAGSPGVSIDVSQLGGMYANSIKLVGTESGVGVSNQGVIAAQSGDLTLTTQGKLVLAGQTQSSGAMSLHAQSVDNSGASYAQQSLALSSTGSVTNSGTLAALEGVTADVGAFSSTGVFAAGMNADGTFSASGPARDLTLTAAQGIAVGGTTAASGNVSMQGADVSLAHGTTSAGQLFTLTGSGDVDLSSATVGAGQQLQVTSGGVLTADQAALTSQGSMQLTAASLSNRQGTVHAATGLGVATTNGTLDNSGGTLQAGGNLVVQASGALQNVGGQVLTSGAHSEYTVSATSIDNTAGYLTNNGDGTAIVSAVGSLVNTGGTVGGQGDLTVAAADLTNTTGAKLVGAGVTTLNVSHSIDNAAGEIFGGTALNAALTGTTFSNAGGTIEGAQSVSLALASLSNQGGTIRANDDITASGGISGAGEMTAGGNLTLNVNGDYTNAVANQLHADGNMTVSATGTLTNNGTLAATGTVNASATNIVNAANADINSSATQVSATATLKNAGRIEGGTVTTSGGTLSNTGTVIGNQVTVNQDVVANSGTQAAIAGAQSLAIHSANTVTNLDGALLYSGGNLEIGKDGTRDASGMLANQTGSVLNRSAYIEAEGDVDIAARTVDNYRTSIVTQAGAPQVSTQSLSLWDANLPIGGPSSKHVSVTFPQWSWNSDQAGISQAMVNALAMPVTVTLPKTQVANLNTSTMTFSLTSPIIEQFTPTGFSTSATCDAEGNCTPDYYTNTLGTNPTQWYQNIVDNGSTYTITFWPDYNPNVNIRPDQVLKRNDLGSDSHDYSETNRTITTTVTTDQLISATAAATIAARGSIRINADNGTISNQSSTMTAGGNLTRRATNGSVSDTGVTLLQTITQTQVSTFYWHQKTGGSSDTQTVQYPMTILPSTTVASLPAIATANGAVQTTAQNIVVASVDRVGQTVVGSGVTGGNGAGTSLGGGSGVSQTVGGTGIGDLKLPASGLYSFNTAPGQDYLVATDPRFTNYSTFISSDYMLNQLGLNPQTTQKRVGDGLYEASLVSQQVTALTGKTYLAGYTSNLDEYTALMNNGVAYAKSFDLVPGVALTSDQMKQLTSDMVWLVSQTVTLPDGSQQTVLVPKLYLAESNAVDLNTTGALVAGNTVSENATGTVANSGHIVSDTATTILGNNVVNQGVIGSAGTTVVAATQDVENISGRIGGDTTLVQAGRDIVNETATLAQTSAASTSGLVGTVTAAGQQATGAISSTSGTALLAGRDIDVNGAAITSDSSVGLAAGRNINVGTMALTTSQDVGTADGLNGGHDSVTNQVGSTITAGGTFSSVSGGDTTLSDVTLSAGGNATMLAGNNLTVTAANDTHTHNEQSLGGRNAKYQNARYDETAEGSNLNAGGAMTLGAGQISAVATLLSNDALAVASDAPTGGGNLSVLGSNVTTGGTAANGTTSTGGAVTLAATGDVTIGAAQETHDAQTWSESKHSGFLSSEKTTDQTTSNAVDAVGSTVSGDTVSAAAGHDLTVVGSTVASTNDMRLSAGHDLTITTSQDASQSSHFHEDVTTGLGGTGGAGLSYGTKDTKETTHDNVVTQNGSLVGSTGGSVTMTAGNDLHITGSDVIAAKDITGTGANVTIDAATGTNHHDDTQETKTSGLTLGLAGSVGDAINSGVQQAQAAASGAGDDRAKALHSIAVAGDAVSAAGGAKALAAGAKGQDAPSIAVQLSYGTSQSKSTFTEDQTTQTGSTVKAGGTASFAATGGGDNASVPGNGNLTIAGSDVSGNNVALTAKDQVNLLNSTDTDSTRSTNKSSSASVGVSYGTQGFGVSASMSNAHGDANSDAVMQNNTHVTAANTVSIVSGGDTNVIGSDVTGQHVSADVGGNLNVASVQDTTVSAAHQSSTSGGFSISQGGGSASFSSTHGDASSNYAAVNEQAGIQAGSGGYDINVKGNTNLTGAYVASTADASKNTLTTGTLTVSDIQNHAEYSASSGGMSVGGGVRSTGVATGVGSVKDSGGVSPMLTQHDSGSDSSATRSGISAGTITLTDASNQTQDVASINRDTSGLNGSVSKNPDLNGLLASQADSMNAAQAAGQTVAQAIGDYASKKQAEAKDPADAAAWSEGGTDRVLLHMAGGALVVGLGGGSALGGAIGAGVSAKMAGELNDISKGIGSDTGSPLIGNIASNIIAGTAGALVGGSSGAFAASNADLYNRQLHPDEKDAIARKANGDTAEEKRLTDAACYAVQCWAQYSPNSDEWAAHYVSPERAAQLGPETQWVQSQQSSGGLFEYTVSQWSADSFLSILDSERRGVAEVARQMASAVRQAAGQGASPDIDPLTAAMDGSDPPSGAAGAVVTPSVPVCVPGGVCTLSPTLALPGTAGYVPSNATFNSGGDGDSSRLVDGGGLQAHEDAGGHLLDRHVGQSEDDLVTRLINEPQISGSSSFPDRATAERVVSETLDANQSTIEDWLAGNSSRLRLDYSSSEPTGISVSKGTSGAVDVNSARVILVRDPSLSIGYRVLTGYPTKP